MTETAAPAFVGAIGIEGGDSMVNGCRVCPAWVTRCWHTEDPEDGDVAVWAVRERDNEAEMERRGFFPGGPCPDCGVVMPRHEDHGEDVEAWIVRGPGIVWIPSCSCSSGLVPVDDEAASVYVCWSEEEAVIEAEQRIRQGYPEGVGA